MKPFTIKLQKKTYTLDDGNLLRGVNIEIAPMVYKFVALTDQKLRLLEEIRPDFYQAFLNASDNFEWTLIENRKFDGVYQNDNAL